VYSLQNTHTVVSCSVLPATPLLNVIPPGLCVHGRYLTPFKTVWDPKDLNEGTLVCGRYAFSQCTLCSCVSHCTPVTATFWCLEKAMAFEKPTSYKKPCRLLHMA
jgi:hypothetical protein